MLFYPRAKWLFVVIPVAVVVLVIAVILDKKYGKDPSPEKLANEIEDLLNGETHGWEVDVFESHYIRNPELQSLRAECYSVGTPETWSSAPEEDKQKIRDVIGRLRRMKPDG